MDIAVFAGDIHMFQGWCDGSRIDPAGNTFSYGAGQDIYKDPASQNFVYFHHNGSPYEPIVLSSGIAKSNCGISFNPAVHCLKTSTGKTKSLIRSERVGLINEANALRALIDGGNKQNLLNKIATASFGIAKNALLAASPYLSDEVLIAYINSNPPDGHLMQVIMANSPVTEAVMDVLTGMSVSSGVMSQINAVQTGKSARQELEEAISYYERETWLMTDELVRFFHNDTIVESPMDSIIAILKEENRPDKKCQVIAAEIRNKDIAGAEADLIAHKQEHGGVLDNYCKLLEVIIELEKVGETCFNMTGNKEQLIRDVSYETEERGCAHAQALLNLAFSEQYPEVVLLDFGSNNKTSGEDNESSDENKLTIEDKYNFGNYPNPYTNMTIITASVPDRIINAQVVIKNIMGQEIARYILQKGNNAIEVNDKNIEYGIYFYSLLFDGESVETKKMLRAR